MYDLDVPSSHIILNIFTDTKNAWSYIFLIIMLILSAFFAGTETAYSYCNKHRLKVLADDGKKTAKLALKILDKFDTTLITTLIGTNIVHSAMSAVTTIMAINILNNEGMGSLLATIITTLVVFFFGDTLPKNIAQANSDRFARIVSYPLYALIILFYPISFIFSCLIKFVRLFLKEKKDETSFTEDDFQDVVEKIEEEGVLDAEESDIIQNAVDFGDITVKEVLTRRDNIVAIDIKNCKNSYLKNFIKNNPYSRIPIYDKNIDNIIGVLHVRTYLRSLFKNKNTNVRDVMTPPYVVSPQISLDEIFEGFKAHKTHLAIIKVKDKTIGMVTMKDVLEELVGDIDEKDTSTNTKEVLH